MRSKDYWEQLSDTYRTGCRFCGYGTELLIPPVPFAEHPCGDDTPEGTDKEDASAETEDCGKSDGGLYELASPVAYEVIRAQIRNRVVGHEAAVRRLALAGLQHMLGVSGQRLLLIGPTGVGKSTLCHALGDALGVPHITIDVSELAETNWHGHDLRDVLQTLRRRADNDEEAMRRAVVVLDEIDKVGCGGLQGTSREYRQGKQESLLGLLGGGVEIPYGPDKDEGRWSWRSDEALVISAGVFEGLPATNHPSPPDLVEWGLMPELVGRLGSILRLAPLGREAAGEVLWQELREVGSTYRELGYRLCVTLDALQQVAECVSSGDRKMDPRSGVRLLRDAAERGLTTMLEEGAAAGSRLELTIEDVLLPDPDERKQRVGFR